MIFIFGTRRLGTVHAVDGVHVVTDFACVNHLPIFPLRSRVETAAYATLRELPLVPTSVIAGYARAWGVVAVLVAWMAVLAAASRDDHAPAAAGAAAFVAVLVTIATVAAWWRLGKLGAEEQAQRRVYAKAAGHPVDVAQVDAHDAAELREALFAAVKAAVPALEAPTSYRTAPDPARDWRALAADPAVNDEAFLRDALTLARIEWRGARGAERRAIARTHGRIWAKLARERRVLEA
jgi:hypothetical protein